MAYMGFDEDKVRSYIRSILSKHPYTKDQESSAVVEINQAAFEDGVWSGGIPEFIEIFQEEWDKKFLK